MLGWILTIRCMLYCQFLGEKIPIFYLGSKIFHSKNLLLASYRDCCCLISFFCHLSSILCPLIELMSLCKQQNKLDVCQCIFLQVNFLLTRAQLDLKSKSVSQLVIMSTMIFHSPENIRLRKEKSLWTKSPFGA